MVESDSTGESERMENAAAVLIVGLLILMTFFLVNWLTDEPEDPETVYRVSINDDAVLGDINAPITIIEFSDYECPACQVFETTTFPLLKEKYIDTGIARFVFRDYPLDTIHPSARLAAEAAECAGEQKKYWEYHDYLYAREGSLHVGVLNEGARAVGLEIESFNNCVAERRYAEEVQRDKLDGLNDGGVVSTPTFFVNGRRLVGVQEIGAFDALIEELQQ